jgi:TolC family type I secretion outer membrane protein
MKVAEATLKHPDVKATRAARRAALSAVRESRAGWYPQVSTQFNNGKVNNDPSAILGTPARAYTNASFNLTVRQLVYDFGATNSQIDANNAKERQALFKQYQAESDVAYRAVQAYHELIRASRQLELAKRNEDARRSILDLVQQRQEIGGGTLSDVVRAKSRLAEALANSTTYQKNLGSVQASYREFFGDSVASVRVDSPVFDVNATGDWLSELGLAGQVGWKVRVAQAANTAAQADVKNARARSFASINLEVSSTRRDWVSPGTPGTDQSVALVARQALYTGGADSARIEQAIQKMQQTEEELRSAELEYKRQIDQLVQEVESAARLVSTRQSSAALAADSLRMVREQYAYRRGTLLDLLTAQETLYFAGRDLIDAQVDRALATYRLLSLAALLNPFMGLSVD